MTLVEVSIRVNPKKLLISFDAVRLKINQCQTEIFNPNQNSIRLKMI